MKKNDKTIHICANIAAGEIRGLKCSDENHKCVKNTHKVKKFIRRVILLASFSYFGKFDTSHSVNENNISLR